jgi:hypothetical protein
MNLMLIIGVALTLAVPVAWAMDIRDWNGGVCRKCAGGWLHFDNDSQGGHGYKCKGGHTVWISYPWVDKV